MVMSNKIERPDGGRFGAGPLTAQDEAQRKQQAAYLASVIEAIMSGEIIAIGLCLLSSEHATQNHVWCTSEVQPLEMTGALWNLANSAQRNILRSEQRANPNERPS
jgi:hypothetical protein